MNVRESIRQATIGEILGAAIWITLLSLPIVGVAWIVIGVLTGKPLVTYEVETVTITRPQAGGVLLDAATPIFVGCLAWMMAWCLSGGCPRP